MGRFSQQNSDWELLQAVDLVSLTNRRVKIDETSGSGNMVYLDPNLNKLLQRVLKIIETIKDI